MTSKFTLVLPTRGLTNQYLPLVIKTYQKYLDPLSIEEILIIIPKSQLLGNNYEKFQSYVKDGKFKFTFITDEEILPANLQATGWYKQQLIKLLIYKYVKTTAYLIVDDDLFLTRPFAYNDLRVEIAGTKYWKYSSEKYCELSQKNYSSLKWWKGSSKLLNFDLQKLSRDNHLMGVTPQIFVTEYVLDLIGYLEHMYSSWITEFISSGSTEYTVYWIYLYTHNLHYMYSDQCIQLWTNNPSYNIVDHCNFDRAVTAIRAGFNETPDYFMVIQSYLGFPANEIAKLQEESFNLSVIEKNNIKVDRNPEYTDIFIVTSIINDSPNTVYTAEERLIQTRRTVDTIRQKFQAPYVPYIILAEMSVLMLDQLWRLNVDALYNFANDVEQLKLISSDKSNGELYLVYQSIAIFLQEKKSYQRLWKISGRYYLNQNFSLSNYLHHPMNVRINQQATHKDVYTVLYQCSEKRVPYLLRVLLDMYNNNLHGQYLEQCLYNVLDPKAYHELPLLGCSGNYSVTGKYIEL